MPTQRGPIRELASLTNYDVVCQRDGLSLVISIGRQEQWAWSIQGCKIQVATAWFCGVSTIFGSPDLALRGELTGLAEDASFCIVTGVVVALTSEALLFVADKNDDVLK